MPDPRLRWLYVLIGTLGGVALGFGIGALAARGVSVQAILWTGLGVVLLWWSLSAKRKTTRGTPEDESDGTHTIE